MALTRAKKEEIVAEVSKMLGESKMTVVATYTGTGVKSMQALKRDAVENGTSLKVLKNTLFIKAMEQTDKFAKADKTALCGQLLYAFNNEDDIAPAQVLANFAKKEQTLEFVGAFSEDGLFMNAKDVEALAGLPSKNQLRAQLVGVFCAPLSGFVGVLSGNMRSVLNVLNARAEAIR